MTLIETVELNAPAGTVWDRLVGSGRVVELVPGLTAGAGGRGTMKITLAGHSVTYRGYARQHIEEPGRRVTWTLSGREMRGDGRAHVEVRARVKEMGAGRSDLRLTVLVDGRGRLSEVSQEVRDRAIASAVRRFCRSLEQSLEGVSAQLDPSPPAPAPHDPPAPQLAPHDQPAPALEIMPPAPVDSSGRWRTLTYLLGGLVLGALVAAAWKGRRHLHP